MFFFRSVHHYFNPSSVLRQTVNQWVLIVSLSPSHIISISQYFTKYFWGWPFAHSVHTTTRSKSSSSVNSVQLAEANHDVRGVPIHSSLWLAHKTSHYPFPIYDTSTLQHAYNQLTRQHNKHAVPQDSVLRSILFLTHLPIYHLRTASSRQCNAHTTLPIPFRSVVGHSSTLPFVPF